jgi:hypothetical protein
MARTQNLVKRLQDRNRRTLAKLPPQSAPSKPEDQQLERRIELSKDRLRRAGQELEGHLRVATWATTAGLALWRWRSARTEKKRRHERELEAEYRRKHRRKILGLF